MSYVTVLDLHDKISYPKLYQIVFGIIFLGHLSHVLRYFFVRFALVALIGTLGWEPWCPLIGQPRGHLNLKRCFYC